MVKHRYGEKKKKVKGKKRPLSPAELAEKFIEVQEEKKKKEEKDEKKAEVARKNLKKAFEARKRTKEIRKEGVRDVLEELIEETGEKSVNIDKAAEIISKMKRGERGYSKEYLKDFISKELPQLAEKIKTESKAKKGKEVEIKHEEILDLAEAISNEVSSRREAARQISKVVGGSEGNIRRIIRKEGSEELKKKLERKR